MKKLLLMTVREAIGISRVELARKAGLSIATIKLIEEAPIIQGPLKEERRKQVKLDTKNRILLALGLRLDDLRKIRWEA